MKTILFPMLLLASISMNDARPEAANKLIGTWVFSEWKDGSIIFEKSDDFDKDKAGIQFLENGALVKRQNAGWCGTPPITYRNYDGKWEVTPKSIVKLSYAFWGGTMEEEWIVVRLNDESMKVVRKEHKTIREDK